MHVPKLTKEKLRTYEAFKHLADKEANEIITSLKMMAKITYELYRRRKELKT